MRRILLTLFLSVYFVGFAQMDDYQRDIVDLLRINGTVLDYGETYDKVFESLKVQFGTGDVPESYWTKLQRDRKAQLDELLPDLAYGYRKHFSHEEIKEMLAIYQRESVQEAVLMQRELREVDDSKVKRFAKSDLGRKMVRVQPELKKDLDEIAAYWKKDIFKLKMQALIRDGYRAGRN